MGRQPSWAISSNVRWAWRLSRRLIWLQSFWNSDIYSSPKFLLFGGTSSFSCMTMIPFLSFSPHLSFLVPPCYLIMSLPPSLSLLPIFALGCFQNPSVRRCTSQQSVISVTCSFIIYRTSKTLEGDSWPERYSVPFWDSPCMQNTCMCLWTLEISCSMPSVYPIRRMCACVMPLHIITPPHSDVFLLI